MEPLDLSRIPEGALLLLDSAPLIFLLEGRAGFAEKYQPMLGAQAPLWCGRPVAKGGPA